MSMADILPIFKFYKAWYNILIIHHEIWEYLADDWKQEPQSYPSDCIP